MKKLLIVVTLAALLTACGQTTSAQPTPAAPLDSVPAVVSASGKLVPASWASLSFQASGQVVALNVQAGDAVNAGDVLAQLEDTDARLAMAQAEAALASAQAQLAQLKAAPQPERVAAAEQAVKAAQAGVWSASAQLAQLRSGARPADIAAAEAAVAAAAAQRKVAQDVYDKLAGCYSVALPDGSQQEVCPGLGTPEEQARAALNSAEASYRAAIARLDQLRSGATQNELDAARASVAAAQAQQATAQAQLDLLKAGATQEQIGVAEAGVEQAQVALYVARAQLAKLQLVAPFDGTIGGVSIHAGEMAAPGQSIVTLGDLSTLRIETTDLSEMDIARVREGQAVRSTFDALPGKTLAGRVARIAPMSTPGQAGVNYTVIVALPEIDPALRWGMTAFVDVQIGQ